MNYGAIKTNDISNGPGIRLSLFVSGCRNHCPGCFNPETWDFEYGEEFTDETWNRICKELHKYQYQGLTILGGDPLEPENISRVVGICKSVKELFPDKDIWLYTGYVIEDRYREIYEKGEHGGWRTELFKHGGMFSNCYYGYCRALEDLIKTVDVIVDGPFVESKKDISLLFRGSSNQRIIDMNKTRKSRKIILWDESLAR